MEFQTKKVEIISTGSTQVHVKLLSTNQDIKMSQRSFQRYLYCGWFEVANKEKLSSVI